MQGGRKDIKGDRPVTPKYHKDKDMGDIIGKTGVVYLIVHPRAGHTVLSHIVDVQMRMAVQIVQYEQWKDQQGSGTPSKKYNLKNFPLMTKIKNSSHT